jgi:hypothetical protein
MIIHYNKWLFMSWYYYWRWMLIWNTSKCKNIFCNLGKIEKINIKREKKRIVHFTSAVELLSANADDVEEDLKILFMFFSFDICLSKAFGCSIDQLVVCPYSLYVIEKKKERRVCIKAALFGFCLCLSTLH